MELMDYAQRVLIIWGLAFVFSMQLCIFYYIKTKSFKSDMKSQKTLNSDYIRFAKQAKFEITQ